MKRIALILALCISLILLSITAYAGSWKSDANGWWWDNGDGTYPKSQWQWCDSNGDGTAECYYFDANGYCLRNTTTPDGYTVNADGAWVKDGAVQTKNASATTTNETVDESKIAGVYDLYAVRVSDITFIASTMWDSGNVTLKKDGTATWKTKGGTLKGINWYFDDNVVYFEQNGSEFTMNYINGVLVYELDGEPYYYYVKSGADKSWIGAITRQEWLNSIWKK